MSDDLDEFLDLVAGDKGGSSLEYVEISIEEFATHFPGVYYPKIGDEVDSDRVITDISEAVIYRDCFMIIYSATKDGKSGNYYYEGYGLDQETVDNLIDNTERTETHDDITSYLKDELKRLGFGDIDMTNVVIITK